MKNTSQKKLRGKVNLRQLGGFEKFFLDKDLGSGKSDFVLAVFEKIIEDDAVLLHSAMQIGEHGRYSIIGWDICDKYVVSDVVGEKQAGAKLDGLGNKIDGFEIKGDFGDLPYKGGYIGYFSYDFGVALNGIKQTVKADFVTDAIYFVLPKKFFVFDQKLKVVYAGLLCFGDDKEDNNDFEEFEGILKNIVISDVSKLTKLCKSGGKTSILQSNVTYEKYEKNIKNIKTYLVNGETYQVNYSQRFVADFAQNPWVAYKKFTQINPSPFQCFFNFENVKVVSNSPERLVCAKIVQNSDEGGEIMDGNVSLENVEIDKGAAGVFSNKKIKLESRPIKGTVPRGKNESEEKMWAEKLTGSEKDAAELIMIVDLVRNDLGRVCEIGTVEVSEQRVIEKYSHVQHTMSNVVGMLRRDKNWMDVIRAMFPGGSITGCPKHRTMKIIDELEEFRRGVYCGSAGYISFDGQFDFNIMIRTLAIDTKVKKAYFNSGGGIVMDSTAEKEYQETIDKAGALVRAVG